MISKVLLIGCGDLAIRLAALLPASFHCYGLRRRVAALPDTIRPLARDLDRDELSDLSGFDLVVITLVPNSRDEAGYRQAYVENMQKIIAALQEGESRPTRVIFVSSTSVYGQSGGEWVDEGSPTEAADFRGRAVLEGEEVLRRSPLPHCIVRFSGIYGPGRERLLKQIRNGEWSERDVDYSNRIHVDDCAGVLAHLLQSEQVRELYLASDWAPVPLFEVKQWLAEQLGLAAPEEPPRVPSGNKRCDNRRLLASGYRFIYPSFREGYAARLATGDGAPKSP